MTKKLLPNGLEVVYSYNDANWVTAITLRQTSNPSNVIQSFEYGYDKVGNRLWVRNADGRGDVYKYDPTYQLVGVKYNVLHPDAGYDMAQGHSRSVTYHYDALGNRTQVVDGSTLTSYSANNLNQITQVGTNDDFAYDADGNLTGDGTWTYGYDREGRLISATDGTTSVTYSYDAVGRRMSKTVGSTTTQYVYSGQDLIEERDGSGAVLASYIYAGGIDNPVAVVQGTNIYFYQQDALGNVTAITDNTGAVVETYTYDVFGQPTIKDASGDPVDEPMQPFLFTGREWDAETGIYHYRTRAYSPELGRFLQADSIGFEGGDWNIYRYVSNNPVNFVDPMGKSKSIKRTIQKIYRALESASIELAEIIGLNVYYPAPIAEYPAIDGFYRHCVNTCKLRRYAAGIGALRSAALAFVAAVIVAGDYVNEQQDWQGNFAGVLNSFRLDDCEQSCTNSLKSSSAANCCSSDPKLDKDDRRCCP